VLVAGGHHSRGGASLCLVALSLIIVKCEEDEEYLHRSPIPTIRVLGLGVSRRKIGVRRTRSNSSPQGKNFALESLSGPEGFKYLRGL